MDGRVLRRHRHHLAAAERHGPQIAILDVLRRGGLDAGLVDLVLVKGIFMPRISADLNSRAVCSFSL